MKSFYVILLLLSLTLSAAAQTNVVSDLTEFNALKALWDSTNGAGWTNNSGWPTAGNWPSSATAAEMDNWYGITVVNGDITQIRLDNNQLTRQLPSAVGNLTKLQTLYVQTNQLTGRIPSALGNLVNIVNLYLNGNQLTGTLPSSLSALTAMRFFHVESNLLSGAVPAIFANMTLLAELSLGNNRFGGTLPTLRGSSTIDVSSNMFTGAFPTITGSIVAVVASNNGFTSVPSAVTSSTLLTKFDFRNNELTSLPSTLASNSNKGNLLLMIQNNQLDFSLLESYASGFKSGSIVVPQKPIKDEVAKVITIGGSLTLTGRAPGAATSMKWQKQSSNGAWSELYSGRTYTKNPVDQTDEGVYRWTSTSTVFPGTTILSEAIQVKTTARFTLDNWCFQYKYDGRKRMTHKKVPGADWVYMVYDDRDRLVMTQDGNQRQINQWSYTKYDALNRPIMTGLYTHDSPIDQLAMSDSISISSLYETFDGKSTDFQYTKNTMSSLSGAFEPLTVTYYDNYDFLHGDSLFLFKPNRITGQATSEFKLVTGQVTGLWIKVLGKDEQWIRSAHYYDDHYRVIQTITDNHKRGVDILTNVYDFVGKVTDSKAESIDHHVGWGTAHPSAWKLEDRIISKASGSTYPYAYSTQQVGANKDGWVEFTCSSDLTFDSNRTFGFRTSSTSGDVDYGVKQVIIAGVASNTIRAMEGANAKAKILNVLGGDVIRIERLGSKMYYKRNGVVFDSTTISSRPATYAYAILNQVNAELFNPKFSTDGARHLTRRYFFYDHAGRLKKIRHNVDNLSNVDLSTNEYNELGQLMDKKLHSSDGVNYHQSVDYRYNIRGWLTSINGAELGSGDTKNVDTSNDRKDLFGMDLLYNETIAGLGNSSMFNGNISAMRWSNSLGLPDTKEVAYRFDYDTMNRLKSAVSKKYDTQWRTASAFHESGVTYDLNGNIKTLKRTDATGSVIDQLDYRYGDANSRTNMLRKVTDTGGSKGFTDAMNVDDDYTYDSNGNLISDKNKGITSIVYNHLNLPEKVTKSTGDYILYTYDATGKKLAQDVYDNAGMLKKRSDYRGEWFFENDTLRFVNHEEGRAVVEGDWVDAPQLLPDPEMTSASGNTESGTTNVTLTAVTANDQSYLKVVSNQSTSTPGFLSPFVNVVPGKMYTFRLKGYVNGSSEVVLYVLGNGYQSGNIVWPGPQLAQEQSNEGWTEVTFKVPLTCSKVRVGATWKSGVTIGAEFYVNRMELFEYNGVHGNAVFSQTGYTYQYHLKDHLGNVRMTFTTKDEVESVKATYEDADMSEDTSNFLNYDAARRVNSSLFDRTNGASPGYSQRLSGIENEKIGLAKSFSVMPGDIIKAEVYAKYYDVPADTNLLPTVLHTLLMNVLSPMGSGGTVVDGSGYSTGGTLGIPWAGGGGDPDENADAPNAYLAYIYMNRDYDPASVRVGKIPLTVAAREDGSNVDHELLSLIDTVKEAGYVYVYLRNDEEKREVYFDDFKVEHIKSPIIQEQSYYPFGLMFGNYGRENSMQQNYLFNGGSELERGLDIGWYHTIFRDYDPSIGRFIQIDPLTDFFPGITSYSFAFDNPVSYDDPDGLAPMWFLQLRANLKQAWYNVTGRGNQHAIIHGKNHGKEVEIGARTAGQRPTPNPRTEQAANTYGKAEEKKEDPGTPPISNPDPEPPSTPSTPEPPTPDPPPTYKGKNIPPGSKINYTEKIKFDVKSDHFSDENVVKSQLGDLVKLLMNNTGITVHIVGNVWGDGIQGSSPEALAQPSALNGKGTTAGGLMNARARAVFKFLVNAGVNPKQLSYGYGNVMKGEAGLSVGFRISNK